MVGGAAPDVSEVQRNRQRVLVTDGVAGIEIKTRQKHVVPLGDAGRIDAQTHERVPRIGVDEDTAVLIPFSRALHSLGIAGPRQDVAGGERAQDQKDVLVNGVGVRLFYTPSIPTASFTASPRPREPWGYAATAPASVQVRHAQCDADLILLAGERRQRGPIKPDFGPDDSIRP